MMSKVSALLFALVALNAANVLAAPSRLGRDVQVNGSESGHSLTFSASLVPSGTSSAPGSEKTLGHNGTHPRLWDDKYCHMPAHHGGEHNGTKHNGTEHPHSWHPHSTSARPSGTSLPETVPSSSAPSSSAPSGSTGGDTSGSFDGNSFDMPSGGDLDATHNSSTSTSSSSDDNDTLQISS